MKRTWVWLAAPALFGAYQYYYTDSLTSVNSSNWWTNGVVTPTAAGLTANTATGGALISKIAVPDGTSEYEVAATLHIPVSGGTYSLYLRATADAQAGPVGQYYNGTGSFYVMEVDNPTWSNGICTATLNALKRVNNTVTLLSSTTIACRDGMVV